MGWPWDWTEVASDSSSSVGFLVLLRLALSCFELRHGFVCCRLFSLLAGPRPLMRLGSACTGRRLLLGGETRVGWGVGVGVGVGARPGCIVDNHPHIGNSRKREEMRRNARETGERGTRGKEGQKDSHVNIRQTDKQIIRQSDRRGGEMESSSFIDMLCQPFIYFFCCSCGVIHIN